MTLGMTIGRSPRGEGPDRPRETHWEGSRPPPAAELVGGGSSSTGHGAGDWESGTLKGRSVHTHRDSLSNYHSTTTMLSFNVINKYTLFKPSHCLFI